MLQVSQHLGIAGQFWKAISSINKYGPLETTNGGEQISTPPVKISQDAKDGRFTRFISQLYVVLRAVVQTPFGLGEIALIKKAFPHLAVGDGQTFFIADHAVIVECPCK